MTNRKKTFLIVFALFSVALNISLYIWNQSLKGSEVSYLLNTPVDRVAFDGQGQVWLQENGKNLSIYMGGAYGGGKLSVYKDGKLIQIFTEEDSSALGGKIGGLEIDNKGQVWIGVQGNERTADLTVFDGKKWQTILPVPGSTTKKRQFNHFDVRDPGVYAIAIDGRGRAWVGVEEEGLYIIDGTILKNYTTSNSDLVDNNVNCIVFDNQGRAWIGTRDGGLNIFDGEVWQTFTEENSPLANDRVYTIAFDQHGRALIASYSTLQVFDGDNWKEIPNTFRVSDLAVDRLGRVWVNSNEGIDVLDGEIRKFFFDPFNYAKFADYIKNNVKRVTYWGSYFFGKLAVDGDGNIWIPTKRGVVIITSDSPQPISYTAGILSIFSTKNNLIYLTLLLLIVWLCITLNAWRSIGFSLLGFPIYLFQIINSNDLSYINYWLFNREIYPGVTVTIAGIIGGGIDILLERSRGTKRTWWGLAGIIIGLSIGLCLLFLSSIT